MADNKYWGYHMTLDLGGCDHEALTSYDTIYGFAKDLVEKIDMVAYGEPQIVNFGSDDKAGYTLVQLIETSNICGHFVNSLNEAYLDVFSCKEFDEQTVLACVEQWFKPQSAKVNFILRKAY
jgi:S-adenosylmethionine/arginine decarboxylase-like enzyme